MKTRELKTQEAWLRTVSTLSEALPYMRQFADETFVIKYGGNAMEGGDASKQFAEDIVLLKQVGINPIIVHGGGPQIGKMLERLKIQSSFIDGLRVTDAAAVEVVEMVLSGSINKQIVSQINAAGGMAVGISGKDGNLIEARKLRRHSKDSEESNVEKILDLAKLMILTDVPGVLNKDKELISELSIKEARKLEKDGVISGGMIPKIETCIHALENDVEAAHILDGRLPHVLLLEVFTKYGAGTMIYRD